MSLYFYARPTARMENRFEDEVAITWADSKRDALERFSEYFDHADVRYVHHVRFDHSEVCVLTDF